MSDSPVPASDQPAALDWAELTRLTAGREFVVERVRLAGSGIAIEGPFALPVLAQLPAEDQAFIVAFVRTHGSIKRMESILGVSYPTVKARLNALGAKLDYVEIDEEPMAEAEATGPDALELLEQGAISVEEALRRLEHRGEDSHQGVAR